LRAARLSFVNQQVSTADKYLNKVMGSASESVLCAILHLQITRAMADTQAVQNLSSLYSQRWPDCVLFSLYLAEAQMELGSEVLAVNLLHDCAAKDAGGMVPTRIWGKQSPYRSLWPEISNFEFNLPIPSSVAAAMGWNQLGTGATTQAPQKPSTEIRRPSHSWPDFPVTYGNGYTNTDYSDKTGSACTCEAIAIFGNPSYLSSINKAFAGHANRFGAESLDTSRKRIGKSKTTALRVYV